MATATDPDEITLFLAGDVMLGRGIDQVLPRSNDPGLHEPYVRSARRYVELAEEASGPIPEPVDPAYVWGDALEVLRSAGPDARIVNLETAVTTADDRWRGKGIHYRMHPENVDVLRAAGIDACALANNHVLDWGYPGLRETLETLERAGIGVAGAGGDAGEARTPAAVPVRDDARVVLFSFGHASSGIPREWAAGEGRPGVDLLPDLSGETVTDVARRVGEARREGDVVVASIHWGGNWGYRVGAEERSFARGLVEEAGVDVVHGHSSHHPRGIEIHRGRPILYGAGDFLNDYEGIGGREEYRGELTLLCLPVLDAGGGGLVRFRVVPMEIRRFRLRRAADADADWLRSTLDRESRELGARVEAGEEGALEVRPA